MIRFLADENFNGKILRGIQRERPDADILRVQDTSLFQAPDPQVLEWAARKSVFCSLMTSKPWSDMPTSA